ncbi:MAG: hypothetical protein KJZ69_06865 [Phycisphaerales bacterium]|nr:hypothetical protein [Phycisphaerales bacterium]
MFNVRQQSQAWHILSTASFCAIVAIGGSFPHNSLAQQASPPFAVFELSTLGGNHSAGWEVAEWGDVIGGAFLPGNVFHPTVWIDGQEPIDLGTLGGPDGECRGINNNGWIVGWAHAPGQSFFDGSAFLWRDGVMENLGDLGGDFAEAYDINDHNQIVGWAALDNSSWPPIHAFLWEDGRMTDLGTLDGSRGSQAIAINNSGLVVGQATSAFYGTWRPVVWENGQIIDLGTFRPENYGDGVCIGLNEAGDVVGYTSRDVRTNQAFIYRNGEKTALPEKPYWTNSFAWSINDNRQIVGAARTHDLGTQDIGVIWEWNRPVRYLAHLIPPRSDWFIGLAIGINNAGQITGTGYRLSDPGYTKGYLLTPVHPTIILAQPAPGRAGEDNTFTIKRLTPGATVTLYASRSGGGTAIPDCTLQQNALQLADPQVIGTAVADSSGVAHITRRIPPLLRGRTVLLQAVVQDECAISQLVVHQFE